MRVINTLTGRVEHPHPMFDTWAEQIEWNVRRYNPEVKSYVCRDSFGTPFCGRVSNDLQEPTHFCSLGEGLAIDRTTLNPAYLTLIEGVPA